MIGLVKVYLPSKLIQESKRNVNQVFHLYGLLKPTSNTMEIVIKKYSSTKLNTDFIGTFTHSNKKLKLESFIQLQINDQNELKCKIKSETKLIKYLIFISDDFISFKHNKKQHKSITNSLNQQINKYNLNYFIFNAE